LLKAFSSSSCPPAGQFGHVIWDAWNGECLYKWEERVNNW